MDILKLSTLYFLPMFSPPPMLGTLYIVATPIGNLEDLTRRAIRILGEVDAILCEDTRVTAKLLASIEVKKPLVTFHQHSDTRAIREIVARLEAGESLALVSDAGTPGISDPGGKLVEAVLEAFGKEAKIVPIPGVSAVTTLLSVSGFPSDKFVFRGFPPQKNGRSSYFREVAATEETVVFYESTHRIHKTLEELLPLVGDRPCVVGRELTKQFETLYRGTIPEVTAQLQKGSIKGEFVIVLRSL